MTTSKVRFLILCGMMLPVSLSLAARADAKDTDTVGAARAAQKAAKFKAKAGAKAERFWTERDRQRTFADAQRVLEQSMRQARDLNVIAIVTKVGDCLQKVKIEQNARGNQLSTVLQPLSMQGATLFNSGSKSFTYWPDQRIVVECDSDTEDMSDIEERAELAAKNYELRVEAATAQVAGRPTLCVVAEPKVPGIPARQFYLDEQTLYPLRLMQETESGWKVNMDTQVVDFPKVMPQINFNLVGTPRKVKFDPALPLRAVRNPKDRLGFNPVVPQNLPFGFRVQRAELRRNEDGQLAMLWLTDGLATARVYEFRCNQMQDGIWSRGTSTVLTEDGVTMMLVSDLQADVRRALLRAFAHRTPESIPPPTGHSVTFGVKPPPVPAAEPGNPKPMLTIPEPENGINEGESDASSADSIAIEQANNVKGD